MQTMPARPGRAICVAAIFVMLVLVRVPFFLTHHVQEDAYISWRCARNFANTGVYCFNFPERVSASTSHAYVFLTAGVIRIAGTHFVPVILTLNTMMFVAAMYLIVGVICPVPRRALWL